MKWILNGWQKVGQIAEQIQDLEELKINFEGKGTVKVVGGLEVETEDELQDLIDYQWNRLEFLHRMVNEKLEPKLVIDRLQKGLCEDCRKNRDPICQEDFFTKSYIKLVELISP